MKNISQDLFPGKFLSLILHIGMVIIIYFVNEDNIFAGISYFAVRNNSEYNDAKDSILAALSLSIIIMIFEIGVLLSGVTLQYPSVSVESIAFHLIGTLLLIWFFLLSWRYQVIWAIFTLTNIFPFAIELATLIVFKVSFYNKYS